MKLVRPKTCLSPHSLSLGMNGKTGLEFCCQAPLGLSQKEKRKKIPYRPQEVRAQGGEFPSQLRPARPRGRESQHWGWQGGLLAHPQLRLLTGKATPGPGGVRAPPIGVRGDPGGAPPAAAVGRGEDVLPAEDVGRGRGGVRRGGMGVRGEGWRSYKSAGPGLAGD